LTLVIASEQSKDYAPTIEHPAIQPQAHFPQRKVLAGEFRDMVTVVVPREHLVDVARFFADDPRAI